jgi:hypothetical protein
MREINAAAHGFDGNFDFTYMAQERTGLMLTLHGCICGWIST